MGYGQNWRKIAQSLESDFHILTFDQRGHGKSMKPAEGYSPEDYADDLKQILADLDWSKINLVGHSMGGRNALNFAFRFPESIEKLVIEDIGPEADDSAVAKIETLLSLVPTPFPNKLAAKEFFLGEFIRRASNRPQPQTLGQYLYSNIEDKADGTADWRFSRESILASLRLGRAKDRWFEARALSCPTLWIRGEQSQDLPRPIFEEVLRVNPNIRGVEISASGHWVHFDQPAKFIEILREFLIG